LGSKKYEKFCETGRKLDDFLSTKKISQLIPLHCGDDSTNIRTDYEMWKKLFYKNLHEKLFTESNLLKYKEFITKHSLNVIMEDDKEYEVKITESPFVTEQEGFAVDNKDYDYSVRTFLNSAICKADSIREMRQTNKNGSTLKIDYSYPESFSYQTGDNIGVFPSNNESEVMYLIKRMNFDPESYVHILKYKQKLSKKISIPSGLTIRELISSVLDLNGRVTKQMIKDILKFVKDQEDYEKLSEFIGSEKKWDSFEQSNHNILDVLRLYESINMSFIDFYKLVGKISPRFYTVASSNNYRPSKLEIVISLVNFNHSIAKSSEKRLGLTSKYYHSMNENFAFSENIEKQLTSTRLISRESGFKLPNNPHTPIIMICTGTGIAPYISFLQEMKAVNIQRETLLLFGSKNSECDFIYKEELTGFIKEGYLKRLVAIFSRDNTAIIGNSSKYSETKGDVEEESSFDKVVFDKKTKYVQDLLEDKKDILEKMLVSEQGSLFVCGGVDMGNDVVKTLENILSVSFMKKLTNEKRLFKELWG